MHRAALVLAAAVATLLLAAVTAAPAVAATSPTTVTFSFDDGLASQHAHRGVLADHGVRATFHVSSNRVGAPGRMTWAELRELADDGHELGGHTLDDRALPALPSGEATRQVCDDRAALAARGYDVRSFAYPGGQANAAVKAIVRGCGYETGRLVGGLDHGDPCCVFAEPLPPRDAFGVRALQAGSGTTAGDFEDAIDTAQSSGGGWLVFVLHDLCSAPCAGAGSQAVSAETLDAVLDWIATQPAVRVATAAAAMNPPADVTPPTAELTAPSAGATVSGTVPLAATAGDDVGVARVDFLVDGAVVASDLAPPWERTWDSTGRVGATVQVAARAMDAAGNATTSAAASVTVRAPPTPPPSPTTYVTLGFDDGLASQNAARPILADHGAHATFFVNTARLGTPGHLTWAQLRALADDGHEIGGHTLDHRALPPLSAEDARRQVCDDRAALVAAGYPAAAFAYPHGQFDAATKAIVAGCGYATARTTGGLDYPDCCVAAEWMPPKDPYAVRAFMPRVTTPLAIYEDVIGDAHAAGGGWVDLVLHGVCADPCAGADEYDISEATLAGLLDWIDAQPGVVVRSTAEVLAAGDRTRPYAELENPPAGATVSGTVTLAADAVDNIGVDRVEFLLDGAVLGSDAVAPYTLAWRTGAAGPARLQVRALDAAGNAFTSPVTAVTVQ